MIRHRSPAGMVVLAALLALTGCARAIHTTLDPVEDPIAVNVPPQNGNPGAAEAGLLGLPVPLPSADSLLNAVVWYPVTQALVLKGTDAVVTGSRYELHFSKGSLDQDQNISIQEYDTNAVDVTLGPHGIKFGTPVELSIDFSGTKLDPSVVSDQTIEPVLYYWNEAKYAWEEVPGKTDWVHRRHIVYLEHFSRYALGGKAGWRQTPSRMGE